MALKRSGRERQRVRGRERDGEERERERCGTQKKVKSRKSSFSLPLLAHFTQRAFPPSCSQKPRSFFVKTLHPEGRAKERKKNNPLSESLFTYSFKFFFTQVFLCSFSSSPFFSLSSTTPWHTGCPWRWSFGRDHRWCHRTLPWPYWCRCWCMWSARRWARPAPAKQPRDACFVVEEWGKCLLSQIFIWWVKLWQQEFQFPRIFLFLPLWPSHILFLFFTLPPILSTCESDFAKNSFCSMTKFLSLREPPECWSRSDSTNRQ